MCIYFKEITLKYRLHATHAVSWNDITCGATRSIDFTIFSISAGWYTNNCACRHYDIITKKIIKLIAFKFNGFNTRIAFFVHIISFFMSATKVTFVLFQ